MGWWNRDPRASADYTDLAHPPSSGGWIKMSLLGFALPAWLIYLGVNAWLSQRAYLPGRGTSGGIWLTGGAARAMAFVHAGVALFAHAHGFWGLLPNVWCYEKLIILACILIVGGVGAIMWLTY
jgi:hypothetical protein